MNFIKQTYRWCWFIAMVIVITCTIVPATIYKWPSSSSPHWLLALTTFEFMVGAEILIYFETKRSTNKDEKKKRILINLAVVILVTGSLMISCFAGEIEVKDVITILVLFGTVLVTAEYANDTKKIAEATKEQSDASAKLAEATKISADASVKLAEATKISADASVEMAEATKISAGASVKMAEATTKQAEIALNGQFNAMAPLLEIEVWDYDFRDADTRIKLVWRNIGTGPALNFRCWIEDEEHPQLRQLGKETYRAAIANGQEPYSWTVDVQIKGYRLGVGMGYLRAQYWSVFEIPYETSVRFETPDRHELRYGKAKEIVPF